MYQIPTYCGYNLTQILMILTVVLWILYDILAYILYGKQFTLSVQMQEAADRHTEIAIFVGAVFAHWFWNVR